LLLSLASRWTPCGVPAAVATVMELPKAQEDLRLSWEDWRLEEALQPPGPPCALDAQRRERYCRDQRAWWWFGYCSVSLPMDLPHEWRCLIVSRACGCERQVVFWRRSSFEMSGFGSSKRWNVSGTRSLLPHRLAIPFLETNPRTLDFVYETKSHPSPVFVEPKPPPKRLATGAATIWQSCCDTERGCDNNKPSSAGQRNPIFGRRFSKGNWL